MTAEAFDRSKWQGRAHPRPRRPSVARHYLFSRVWPIVWIGTQGGKQFLLECTLLRQVVLDGLGVFGEIIGRIVALVEASAME